MAGLLKAYDTVFVRAPLNREASGGRQLSFLNKPLNKVLYSQIFKPLSSSFIDVRILMSVQAKSRIVVGVCGLDEDGKPVVNDRDDFVSWLDEDGNLNTNAVLAKAYLDIDDDETFTLEWRNFTFNVSLPDTSLNYAIVIGVTNYNVSTYDPTLHAISDSLAQNVVIFFNEEFSTKNLVTFEKFKDTGTSSTTGWNTFTYNEKNIAMSLHFYGRELTDLSQLDSGYLTTGGYYAARHSELYFTLVNKPVDINAEDNTVRDIILRNYNIGTVIGSPQETYLAALGWRRYAPNVLPLDQYSTKINDTEETFSYSVVEAFDLEANEFSLFFQPDRYAPNPQPFSKLKEFEFGRLPYYNYTNLDTSEGISPGEQTDNRNINDYPSDTIVETNFDLQSTSDDKGSKIDVQTPTPPDKDIINRHPFGLLHNTNPLLLVDDNDQSEQIYIGDQIDNQQLYGTDDKGKDNSYIYSEEFVNEKGEHLTTEDISGKYIRPRTDCGIRHYFEIVGDCTDETTITEDIIDANNETKRTRTFQINERKIVDSQKLKTKETLEFAQTLNIYYDNTNYDSESFTSFRGICGRSEFYEQAYASLLASAIDPARDNFTNGLLGRGLELVYDDGSGNQSVIGDRKFILNTASNYLRFLGKYLWAGEISKSTATQNIPHTNDTIENPFGFEDDKSLYELGNQLTKFYTGGTGKPQEVINKYVRGKIVAVEDNSGNLSFYIIRKIEDNKVYIDGRIIDVGFIPFLDATNASTIPNGIYNSVQAYQTAVYNDIKNKTNYTSISRIWDLADTNIPNMFPSASEEYFYSSNANEYIVIYDYSKDWSEDEVKRMAADSRYNVVFSLSNNQESLTTNYIEVFPIVGYIPLNGKNHLLVRAPISQIMSYIKVDPNDVSGKKGGLDYAVVYHPGWGQGSGYDLDYSNTVSGDFFSLINITADPNNNEMITNRTSSLLSDILFEVPEFNNQLFRHPEKYMELLRQAGMTYRTYEKSDPANTTVEHINIRTHKDRTAADLNPPDPDLNNGSGRSYYSVPRENRVMEIDTLPIHNIIKGAQYTIEYSFKKFTTDIPETSYGVVKFYVDCGNGDGYVEINGAGLSQNRVYLAPSFQTYTSPNRRRAVFYLPADAKYISLRIQFDNTDVVDDGFTALIRDLTVYCNDCFSLNSLYCDYQLGYGINNISAINGFGNGFEFMSDDATKINRSMPYHIPSDAKKYYIIDPYDAQRNFAINNGVLYNGTSYLSYTYSIEEPIKYGVINSNNPNRFNIFEYPVNVMRTGSYNSGVGTGFIIFNPIELVDDTRLNIFKTSDYEVVLFGVSDVRQGLTLDFTKPAPPGMSDTDRVNKYTFVARNIGFAVRANPVAGSYNVNATIKLRFLNEALLVEEGDVPPDSENCCPTLGIEDESVVIRNNLRFNKFDIGPIFLFQPNPVNDDDVEVEGIEYISSVNTINLGLWKYIFINFNTDITFNQIQIIKEVPKSSFSMNSFRVCDNDGPGDFACFGIHSNIENSQNLLNRSSEKCKDFLAPFIMGDYVLVDLGNEQQVSNIKFELVSSNFRIKKGTSLDLSYFDPTYNLNPTRKVFYTYTVSQDSSGNLPCREFIDIDCNVFTRFLVITRSGSRTDALGIRNLRVYVTSPLIAAPDLDLKGLPMVTNSQYITVDEPRDLELSSSGFIEPLSASTLIKDTTLLSSVPQKTSLFFDVRRRILNSNGDFDAYDLDESDDHINVNSLPLTKIQFNCVWKGSINNPPQFTIYVSNQNPAGGATEYFQADPTNDEKAYHYNNLPSNWKQLRIKNAIYYNRPYYVISNPQDNRPNFIGVTNASSSGYITTGSLMPIEFANNIVRNWTFRPRLPENNFYTIRNSFASNVDDGTIEIYGDGNEIFENTASGTFISVIEPSTVIEFPWAYSKIVRIDYEGPECRINGLRFFTPIVNSELYPIDPTIMLTWYMQIYAAS